MASNDNTNARMQDMTFIQLKDKLRRRKMKTTDVKADLIKRLEMIMMYEEKKDNSDSDDEEQTTRRTINIDTQNNRHKNETDNERTNVRRNQ